MLAPNPHNRLTIEQVLDHPWMRDRDKLQKQHLGDTVEELKRFNARRKLKGAVQAIAGGIAMDPFCGADTDSVAVGTASESLNEWADEEAGLEAVQMVLDSLDDIHALQDAFVDQDVLIEMLRDVKLHALLQLYDRISYTVMSPSRTPPGDGILRCRDAIDIVSSAPGHKYIRDRNELLQLLTLPHIQNSENNFEAKLRKQRFESEIDSKWLQQKETNLKKRLSLVATSQSSKNPDEALSSGSFHEMLKHPQSAVNVETNAESSASNKSSLERKTRQEPTKTIPLDRSNDNVYSATTKVVKAIMLLSQGVEKAAAVEYLHLVRHVGVELRTLLQSVDTLASAFPQHVLKEVEMAHKVLAKDMSELISTMRLAQQYSETTLDVEYRKNMLSAAHVLAMDAKNLLDVVDSVRIRHPELFIGDEVHKSTETSESIRLVPHQDLPSDLTEEHSSIFPHFTNMMASVNLHDDFVSAQQEYQNLSQLAEQSQSSMDARNDIYVNQEQLQQLQPLQERIYDNDCIVNAQLKTLNSFANSTNKVSQPLTKPPVAAKPVRSSNLQQKIAALNNAGLSVSAVEKVIPPLTNIEEPLKIIENEQDLYSNTKVIDE